MYKNVKVEHDIKRKCALKVLPTSSLSKKQFGAVSELSNDVLFTFTAQGVAKLSAAAIKIY